MKPWGKASQAVPREMGFRFMPGGSLYRIPVNLERIYGEAHIYIAECGSRRSHSSVDGGSYLRVQHFSETWVNR